MAKKTRNTPRVRRSAAPENGAPPKTVTGYAMPPKHAERALLTGESRGLLEDYFGPEAYVELRDLARDSATRSVRGGPRVLILPGIMGSTLAKKGFLGDDVLWVDPIEIALGRLTELKLDGRTSAYHEAGAILLAYLKLKLRLRIAGFDADFFSYDWRQSLHTLGAKLADAIASEPAAQVNLVAHSMGGLVARAALGATGKKVARLVMLGTPNYGSFAPVQVLRGTYDVVQKIARLDLKHTAEQLCGDVFNTFPGLYEMLPAPEKFSTVDLYHPSSWPKTGPQPKPALLSAVKGVTGALAPADSRFFLIAGVNQDTVTGVSTQDGEFVYEVSPEGDGTVPLAFAKLADIPEDHTYYVEETHGSLPNNGAVETAVIDLLSTGTTAAVSSTRPEVRRATRMLSEGEVREMARQAAGTGALGSADYRHILDSVAAPVSSTAVSAPAAGLVSKPAAGTVALNQRFEHLVIGRRRQRRMEITLALGSITEVDSRAYVLGVFRNVAPSGAAKAIDERLDGAISEFTARRMLSGNVGEIFTVPVGRNHIGADMVLFAGLGPFDSFNADVQQLVAENIVRVLVRSRIDEFATVLIGSGSGQSTAASLQNLLTGFFRGARDTDPHHRFRGITVCETNPARYAEIKAELFRLAGTPLFDDIEVTFEEIEVPAPAPAVSPRVLVAGPEPVYMIVRQEGQARDRVQFRISILGSGMKAAVVSAVREVDAKALGGLLIEFDRTVGPGSDEADLQPLGTKFADLVLPPEVCTVLDAMRERHLVVVHDAQSARVPWETLSIRPRVGSGWSPAVAGGLSRRYAAENLPIATWLEQRRTRPGLKLLLVVNPLGDLPGAETESKRVKELAASTARIEVTEIANGKATKAAVLAALRTGAFDIVHYAGHAFFDPAAPARSGLICAGREVLSGGDLIGISNLPFLVFFNACEAGRVRGRAAAGKAPSARVAESVGVAEALMRGGVANYMSTYWPVGDDAAMGFASTFYKDVLAGKPIGAALLNGRKTVQGLKSRDWADYVLYGSFDFVLKQPES